MAKKTQKINAQQKKYVIIFIVLFAIIGSFLLGRSFAASSPVQYAGSGTCSVSPSNPAVQQQYTITALNISSKYSNYQFFVQREGGLDATAFLASNPDANGTVTASGYSIGSGTYDVQLRAQTNDKRVLHYVLATCSYVSQ